jgi:hypothetical protein
VKQCVRVSPTIQFASDAGKLIQHFSGGKVTEILKLGFARLPALVAQVLQKIFDERLHFSLAYSMPIRVAFAMPRFLTALKSAALDFEPAHKARLFLYA